MLGYIEGRDGFFWNKRTPFYSSRRTQFFWKGEPHFLGNPFPLFVAVRSPSSIFRTCSVTSPIFTSFHTLELPWGRSLHNPGQSPTSSLPTPQAPLAHNVTFTGSGPRSPQQGWLIGSGDNIGKMGSEELASDMRGSWDPRYHPSRCPPDPASPGSTASLAHWWFCSC